MSTNHSGLFITIEGVEGAGKSTSVKVITKVLQERGIDFITTREPGGTEIAEVIRQVILNHYGEKMAIDTELLLYFAGRAQHLESVIKPALAEGKVVLCDRFTDATFAYQGGGRGISQKHIAGLESWLQGNLRPDVTILLDVSPEVGLSRIQKRKGGLDRIEQEKIDFFERVREVYLQRAKQYSEQYRILDAGIHIAEMKKTLKALVNQVLDEYER